MTDITSEQVQHHTVSDESRSAVTMGLALKTRPRIRAYLQRLLTAGLGPGHH